MSGNTFATESKINSDNILTRKFTKAKPSGSLRKVGSLLG